MRATRCAFHRRIASPSPGELSGRLDDQRFTLSRQREAALLEDLFTRRPLDNCWQAHRVFTRLRGALPALARQGGDRQFGHGWGEGYERGRQAGASAQDAVAQKESAMRDGTIAACGHSSRWP